MEQLYEKPKGGWTMYRTADGESIFVLDGHVHWWNASPDNWRNRHGQEFIDCFHDYQKNLSPKAYIWEDEKFRQYDQETLLHDLFVEGYDDMAIFQPTYLTEFYKAGFNTTERDGELWRQYPDRFLLNGAFDPREGEAGIEYLHFLSEEYSIKGVKLYTAEWRGASKGWDLRDPWSLRYLETCEKLGITNIHIHKGPTIKPLNMDAFDVHDVDEVASAFPNLNFIVEHVGLPRLDDFCWIAQQEPNVYGGLAVAMPFIYTRPRYFATIISELLFWLNEDRLLFGSDYAIWHPKWLIEKFMAFQLPQDIADETGVSLTLEVKRKILGENAARLYGIDIPKQLEKIKNDRFHAQVA